MVADRTGGAVVIDWQTVLLNLRQSGMPLSRVATAVGFDAKALCRYARGEARRDPPMTPALRLLDLHRERCPQQHTPRVIGQP